jgi:hypothetical protein
MRAVQLINANTVRNARACLVAAGVCIGFTVGWLVADLPVEFSIVPVFAAILFIRGT